MSRNFSAFVISVLLHVGLFALAFIVWKDAPKPLVMPSVPVTIVSSVPSRQQAEAPVDKLAVKAPVPIPAPEVAPKPVPTPPVPAPKLPIPVPVKPQAKPEPVKPVKTPAPKPVPVAPPDKNGMKKPVPPKNTKPSLDLNALSQMAATPSHAPTRQQAQANTHHTDGISEVWYRPADAGDQAALDILGEELRHNWIINCDVPGSRDVNPHITFMLSSNGRVLLATWDNRNNDPVWIAGANLALAAVNKGQPYTNLPPGLDNKKIGFTFSAEKACRGQ